MIIPITAALLGHNVGGLLSWAMVTAIQELIAEKVPGAQLAMQKALVRSGAPRGALAKRDIELFPVRDNNRPACQPRRQERQPRIGSAD